MNVAVANALPTRLLSGLIATLGHGQFAHKLMSLARDMTGADLMSAFEFSRNNEPLYLIGGGCSQSEARFSQVAGERYAAAFWRKDRSLGDMLASARLRPNRIFCQRSNDISDSAYRDFCYDSHSVLERVSIFHTSGTKPIMLNLYRYHASGAFNANSLSHVEESGGILGALVSKHAEITAVPGPALRSPNLAGVGRALREACPALSVQEVEVCAGLLTGHSYKEIARQRGLMSSSVVTYRKRAYAKLGIDGRTELEAIYENAQRRLQVSEAGSTVFGQDC